MQDGKTVNHTDAGHYLSEHQPPTKPSPKFSLRKDSPYLGVSESLMYTLVDLYFENAYNSSLLLHKRRFVESLMAGTVEAHLILSVCAYAAKYLTRTPSHILIRLTYRSCLASTVTKTAGHLSVIMVS